MTFFSDSVLLLAMQKLRHQNAAQKVAKPASKIHRCRIFRVLSFLSISCSFLSPHLQLGVLDTCHTENASFSPDMSRAIVIAFAICAG
jgi:hypothetical protein